MSKQRILISILVGFSIAWGSVASAQDRFDPLLRVLHRAQTKPQISDSSGKKNSGSVALSAEEALDLIGAIQVRAKHKHRLTPQKLNLLLEFHGDESELAGAGVDVLSKVGAVYAGVLDAARLGELLGVRGFRYAQLSHRLGTRQNPHQDVLLPSPGLEASELSRPKPARQGGAGVLIGFIDTGVDVFHSDFRKSDGTTRIKYLLDLSDPGDVDGDGTLDGPDDLGGTLYTEQEINLALRSARDFRAKDSTGHGTHGLSVAAGNDPVLPGIAPGADLIIVKATREDGSLEFQSVDILGSLSFIDRKAGEVRRPYVINLSLGTTFAPHDGRSLEELAIDSLVGPSIPGKAVVLAAGNTGDNRGTHFRHFSGQAFAGITSNVTLTLPAYSISAAVADSNQMLLDIWYQGRDRLSITVTAPDQVTRVHASYGEIANESTPLGRIFIGNLGGRNPLNGDTEAIVFIDGEEGGAPAAGDWTISFTGEGIEEEGIYHGWLIEGSAVGDAEPWISRGGDNRYLVAKPAGARNGIAVGSFSRHKPGTRYLTKWTDVGGRKRSDPTARLEDISNFSSTGGTRDGRIKPEILAPGEQVVGAVSKDAYPGRSPSSIYSEHPFRDIDALIVQNTPMRAFAVLQGTSFAAPVITGMVALLLAADPQLDATELRNILENRCISDRFTGGVPNDHWGYGKVDLSLATSPGAALARRLQADRNDPPQAIKGRPYSFVLTASGGVLPYSWSITSGALPPGLRLGSSAVLTGTPTVEGNFTFTLEVRDAARPAYVDHTLVSLTVLESPSLTILTEELPFPKLKEPYAYSMKAEGGTPPYTWSLRAGSLPEGLSLASTGNFHGSPIDPVRADFTLQVTDSASASSLRSFSLEVQQIGAGDWRPLGIIYGNVSGIVVDPNDPRRLYASTDGSSFLYFDDISESSDDGETWHSIAMNNSFGFGRARKLTINPVTSEVWVLGGPLPLVYNSTIQDWKVWNYCGDRSSDYDTNNSKHVQDFAFDDAGRMYVYAREVSCPNKPWLSRKQAVMGSIDTGSNWDLAAELPFVSPSADCLIPFGSLSIYGPDPRTMYLGRSYQCGFGLPYRIEAEEFFSTSTQGRSWVSNRVNAESVVVPYVSQRDPLDVLRFSLNPYSHPGSSLLERSRDGGASWTALAIPGTPRVCLVARSRTNPEVVLAGTTTGLYKSVNSGSTWRLLHVTGLPFGDPSLCGGSLAIDPNNPDRLFSGIPMHALFESVDGGETWEPKGRGLFRRSFSGLALRPDQPTELFVVSGIPHVSRRAGERWTRSEAGVGSGGVGNRFSFPIILPQTNTYLFLGQNSDVLYRSENRGVTWKRTSPRFNGAEGRLFFESIASDPFDENVLLARVTRWLDTPGVVFEGEGIWRSEDQGLSWNRAGEAGESPTANFPQYKWESAIAFASDVEGRVYSIGAEGLYRSEDKGSSWRIFVPLSDVSSYNSALTEPAPSDSEFVYIARQGTVFVRNPSASEMKVTKFQFRFIISMAIDARNPLIAYLGMQYSPSSFEPPRNGSGGIWKTTDAGGTWSKLPGFSDSLSVISLVAHPRDPGILYAATWEDGIYRTIDGGVTWSRLDNYGTVADAVNVLIRHPSNPYVLFAATEGFGVQISFDGGQTFTPSIVGLGNLNVLSLAVDPGDPQTLYAGTEKGLFKTQNGGSSWAVTGLTDGIVTDIVIDRGAKPRRIKLITYNRGVFTSDDDALTFQVHQTGLSSLALTSIENDERSSLRRTWVTMRGGEGVAFSDDGGKSWKSAAGNGLTNRDVNDLAIEPPPSSKTWIATDKGVFYTDDAGKSWQKLSLGLPAGVPVSSITIDSNTREVLVSLLSERNGGIYRGGNLNGFWAAFNEGLRDLSVRKLTTDGGHNLESKARATTLFAATSRDGLYSMELQTTATQPPHILTESFASARVGQTYEARLVLAGGVPPYLWSLANGTLPPGLALDREEGSIVGLPVRPGAYAFSIHVTDSKLRQASKEFMISVMPP